MEGANFHVRESPWLFTSKESMLAEQSDQTLLTSTYHDNRDPGGGAVLFGERVIKVLFEFTCYFSLHIILLGGIILQERKESNTMISDSHT